MAIKVYEFVGQRTGKVYARGYKRDCLRKLQKEYPSTSLNKWGTNTKPIMQIYPEPITFKEVR